VQELQSASSESDLPLRGRHAVVTGAARGIGAAIAATLARRGADVTLMDITSSLLGEQAAALQQSCAGRAQGVEIDITQPDSVVRAFAEASAQFGAPHILVNSAGIAPASPFSKLDLPTWQKVIDVDLTGAFLCTREVVRAMTRGDYGRIVNVASTAGLTGYPYVAAYCAAKHGLVGLTRALARELARTAVTVNAVCPGYADTDLVAGAIANIVAKTGRSPEEALQELTAHNPQGRLVNPQEIADTVAWLCLPSSTAITGQSIVVAGGELM
jgi:NAD(P)-dependent dehydrogenase (short-subunit alcohol dehydrogenase family)